MSNVRIILAILIFITACNSNSMIFLPAQEVEVQPTTPNDQTQVHLISETQTVSLDDSNKAIKFNGAVVRDATFEHELSQNIVFRLEANPYGWHIWMGHKTKPDEDYVAVITPPYYGMNARSIEGWHFRNSDNSGPNQPGEKLVNAPQKERRFYFLLNEIDYQIAEDGLDTRGIESEEKRKQLQEKREQLKPREGMLTITHLELGNLGIGKQAWIEYMEFEVELNLPSDF